MKILKNDIPDENLFNGSFVSVVLFVFIMFVIYITYINHIDRFYIEGMYIDNDILSQLTSEQKKALISSGIHKSYAKYDGNDVINITLKKDDEYESSILFSNTNTPVGVKSGLAFHLINGELHAYSSGDVRENPKYFKAQIAELVKQVDWTNHNKKKWQ